MKEKTKNIIIIVLAVLLSASVMLNIINIRPSMSRMQHDNMMQRSMNGPMNDNRQFNRPDRNQNMPQDNQNVPEQNQQQENNNVEQQSNEM